MDQNLLPPLSLLAMLMFLDWFEDREQHSFGLAGLSLHQQERSVVKQLLIFNPYSRISPMRGEISTRGCKKTAFVKARGYELLQYNEPEPSRAYEP